MAATEPATPAKKPTALGAKITAVFDAAHSVNRKDIHDAYGNLSKRVQSRISTPEFSIDTLTSPSNGRIRNTFHQGNPRNAEEWIQRVKGVMKHPETTAEEQAQLRKFLATLEKEKDALLKLEKATAELRRAVPVHHRNAAVQKLCDAAHDAREKGISGKALEEIRSELGSIKSVRQLSAVLEKTWETIANTTKSMAATVTEAGSFVSKHWRKMAGAAGAVAIGGWALHEMNKRSAEQEKPQEPARG